MMLTKYTDVLYQQGLERLSVNQLAININEAE